MVSVIPLSAATVKKPDGRKAAVDKPPAETKLGMVRMPSGQYSRSLYIITTRKRLVKRIPKIEEKSRRYHEFRNNDYTVGGRGHCAWDGKGYDDPIHHEGRTLEQRRPVETF
jgi:hypothetical protein